MGETARRLERRIICGGRRLLAGLLAIALTAAPIPEAEAAQFAEIDGFQVWIQWASGSSAEELNWNSVREEEKTVTLQVNYRSNEGGQSQGFAAGSVRIQVPGIGMASRTSVQQAEGVADNSGGEPLWDYVYDSSADTYTFTNRKEIDRETSFSGSFQIAWNFNSREVTHGYRQTVQAQLETGGRTEKTNAIGFSFTSSTDVHELEAEANALEGPDGLGENANSFYWVRYGVKETISEKARGAADKYYTVQLPEGAVLKRVGEGDATDLGGGLYRFPYKAYQNVYVAYPKSQFGGDRAEQTFTLYGTYLDTEDEVKLAETTASVTPNDYGFVYNGSLYWVGKGGAVMEEADAVRKDRLYDGQVLNYSLMAIARYPEEEAKGKTASAVLLATESEYPVLATGSEIAAGRKEPEGTVRAAKPKPAKLKSAKPKSAGRATESELTASPSESGEYLIPEEDDVTGEIAVLSAQGRGKAMDIYLCDDFIDITDRDGSFRQLGDEEYEMVDLTIPSCSSFTNANGFPVESGKYTAEIVLGTDRHGEAAAAFPIDESSHTYRFPEGTNRFFIRIRNVTESLYINQFDIGLNVEYHLNPDKPVMDSGIIRNNDGLIVEYGGAHHNTVFDDSYLGSDAERVRQRDLDTYGLRVQRWYYNYPYESDTVYHDVNVFMDEFQGTERGYEGEVRFQSLFYRAENLEGWSLYSLLPLGMTADLERDEAQISISRFKDEFGDSVSSAFLEDGFSLLVTDDFRGTGRTLVEGRFDYEEAPVSCGDLAGLVSLRLPVRVSFEGVEEYGTSYVVGAEQILKSDGKRSSAYATDKNGRDDGTAFNDPDWADVDEDGDTGETLVFNSAAASITQVMATQMELKKTVSTPRTYGGYWTNWTEEGESRDIWAYFGHEYVYRLNLRNTGTPAKHVVIYDRLETGISADGEGSQWRGTFRRADVSRAEELGLEPAVWYSVKENPGTLESGDWTEEQPADLSDVRAVAVEFLAERMKTAEDVWIDLYMVAPPEEESLKGKRTVNGFSASFFAGGRDDRLDSNPVEVKLDRPKGTVAVEKVDAVSGEKLTGYVFELRTKDGELAAAIDEDGMTPEDVETGEYLLKEIKAPAGYGKVPDQEISIQMGLNRIRVEDPRLPGQIRVIKKDASDPERQLEGAVFALRREDGTLAAENLETDETGTLTISDLEWGTYYLEETKAPDGHYLYGGGRKYVTLNGENLSVELELENRSYGSAVLTKKDKDRPGTYVAGAVYQLFDDRDRLVGTYTTDENGVIRADELEWGTYYFLEKEAAPGYEKNPARIEFTIYRDNALTPVELETEDEEKSASVRLTKYDGEDRDLRLSGAVYALKRKEGDGYMDMGSYKTDRRGELFIENLKFGAYILQEIAAPEGYELTEGSQVEFTLGPSTAGQTLELTHENIRRKGALVLQKTDEEDVPVEGAVFDLYRDGNLYMENLVTDEYGLAEVGSLEEPVLEWGTYTLKEKEAPEGYILSGESWEFVIDSAHVRVPVTVKAVNRRQPGSVKLIKYKKGEKDVRVEGAEYGLYDTEGKLLQRQRTDENGEAVFGEIPWGAYYLQEISAPDPYVVSDAKLRFSINRDNCHVQQILEGEDEVKRTSLTITKKIEEDIYEPFGAPAFLYRIEGRDGTGSSHVWYRQIVLGEGERSGSVTLANIEASDENGYKITELPAVRYQLMDISGTHVHSPDLSEGCVTADLSSHTEAEAVFTNHLKEWQKYTHTSNAVNLVKKARSLTYLEVEYEGPEDVTAYFEDGAFDMAASRDFLNRYLTVTAYYDAADESGDLFRNLSPGEYRLEPGTLEGQGGAAPYTYHIRVVYQESGVEREGSFQVMAQAEKALYTLIYHDPHGKNTGTAEQKVRYGSTVLLSPDAPAGYAFGGWYESAGFEGQPYGGGETYTNEDRSQVDLYGKWTPMTYPIAYHLNGGTMAQGPASYTVETDSFSLPVPARAGYEFAGWTGSNGSTPQKTVTIARGSTGDKVFYANWTPLNYTITYQLNGGTMTGQKTVYTVETADFVLPQPGRDGFEFTGWTGSNGSTPQTDVVIRRGTMGNLSYTANWRELYGVLDEGPDFNGTVKELSTGQKSHTGTANTAIKSIQVTRTAPEGVETALVSAPESPVNIYAYFDGGTGTIYIVSPVSDLRLNPRSNNMFQNIDAVASLDLTMFGSAGLKNISGMFRSCDSLTEINLSKLDTSQVEQMAWMFDSCRSLKTLDLRNFNTANVRSMFQMFGNDKNLTTIQYGSGFVYKEGCDAEMMFYLCPANKPAWNGTWHPSSGGFKPA